MGCHQTKDKVANMIEHQQHQIEYLSQMNTNLQQGITLIKRITEQQKQNDCLDQIKVELDVHFSELENKVEQVQKRLQCNQLGDSEREDLSVQVINHVKYYGCNDYDFLKTDFQDVINQNNSNRQIDLTLSLESPDRNSLDWQQLLDQPSRHSQ